MTKTTGFRAASADVWAEVEALRKANETLVSGMHDIRDLCANIDLSSDRIIKLVDELAAFTINVTGKAS